MGWDGMGWDGMDWPVRRLSTTWASSASSGLLRRPRLVRVCALLRPRPRSRWRLANAHTASSPRCAMPEPLQSAPLLKCTHPSPPSPRPSACARPRARPHALAQDLTQAHSRTARHARKHVSKHQAATSRANIHFPVGPRLPNTATAVTTWSRTSRTGVGQVRPHCSTLCSFRSVHAAEGGCAAS